MVEALSLAGNLNIVIIAFVSFPNQCHWYCEGLDAVLVSDSKADFRFFAFWPIAIEQFVDPCYCLLWNCGSGDLSTEGAK